MTLFDTRESEIRDRVMVEWLPPRLINPDIEKGLKSRLKKLKIEDKKAFEDVANEYFNMTKENRRLIMTDILAVYGLKKKLNADWILKDYGITKPAIDTVTKKFDSEIEETSNAMAEIGEVRERILEYFDQLPPQNLDTFMLKFSHVSMNHSIEMKGLNDILDMFNTYNVEHDSPFAYVIYPVDPTNKRHESYIHNSSDISGYEIFYKVWEGYVPDEEWLNTAEERLRSGESGFYSIVRSDERVSNVWVYYDVVITETRLNISFDPRLLNKDRVQRHIMYTINRSFRSLEPYNLVGDIEYNAISLTYNIVPENPFDIDVFAYLVTNNPVVSELARLNESVKKGAMDWRSFTTKQRQYFFIEPWWKISGAREKPFKISITRKEDSSHITINIHNLEKMSEFDRISELIHLILKTYDREYDDIVAEYKTYFKGFKPFKSKIKASEDNNFHRNLKRTMPRVFGSNYAKSCTDQPNIHLPTEEMRERYSKEYRKENPGDTLGEDDYIQEMSYIEHKKILHDKYIEQYADLPRERRMALKKKGIANDEEYADKMVLDFRGNLFTCDDGKHSSTKTFPYMKLNKENPEFPCNPCCKLEPPKTKDQSRYGCVSDKSDQNHVMKLLKLIDDRRLAMLPINIENILDGEFLREGVENSSDSFLRCVSRALSIPVEEIKDLLELDNVIAAGMQSLVGVDYEGVFYDENAVYDPIYWVRAVEVACECNIILFTADKKMRDGQFVAPFYTSGYVKPIETYDRYIAIMIHRPKFGHPVRCELVRRADEEIYDISDQTNIISAYNGLLRTFISDGANILQI